jgi:excisionase family DNA binding protein
MSLPQSAHSPFSNQDKPLLVHHVADRLGVSRRTVRWWADNGILEGFKDPRTPKPWRFKREVVEAFRVQREISGRCSRSKAENKTNCPTAELRFVIRPRALVQTAIQIE